jgi:signal recognition particle subunit SRP54
MFDALSERFERLSTSLRSRGRLSDADLDEASADVRSALLEADVELGVVRAFLDAVRERLSGEALSQSLSPGQQVIKAVHEQLVEVLGGTPSKITYAAKPPTVVLLAGLQGAGKTTAAAKFAAWFKQQGRQPYLVAADLQRPAAVEQLRVLGGQIGVDVFSESESPINVARRASPRRRDWAATWSSSTPRVAWPSTRP